MKAEGGQNEANEFPWGSVEEDLREACRLIESFNDKPQATVSGHADACGLSLNDGSPSLKNG